MFSQLLSLIPLVVLAILPSLIWLFFYLKEDPHPEPRLWLIIMFIMGVALAPIVIFAEMAFGKALNFLAIIPFGGGMLMFVIAPLVEEAAKYGAVHLSLNKNPVLDEPVDCMIYIIVAALGFAAIENIFAIFSFISVGAPGYFSDAFNFMSMRFISAVALHGLASGIMGYFFARFYFIKRNPLLIVWGIFLASLLHGIYNFLLFKDGQYMSLILTGGLLLAAAALVMFLFNRLKYHTTYQQVAVDNMEK
ncbi:MAG: PrsW family glutamic-type intramembrane protease [Patescibacteria group bacterium]